MTGTLLVRCVEQGGTPIRIGDSWYAAVPDPDARGWWVWELLPGSPEYFSTADRCTCPHGAPCKHAKAVAQLRAPWVQLDAKLTRPKGRGEC